MTGLDPEEALGDGWLRSLHPEDRQQVYSDWQKMLASEGLWDREYRFQAGDGTVTWVYGLATPQRDSAGDIVRYIVVNTDITDRKAAEEALKASLAEKDVLLREVHHRVKNNMAAIIGLFDLQRQAMKDTGSQTIMAELSSRVRAMSLVHEKLYRSETLSRIDFQDYIQSLISHLRTSFGSPGIRCEIAALGVEMPLDLAVPCGMIINELVTNALKYAFPHRGLKPPSGEDLIQIAMSHEDETFTLSVTDNGIGLPPGFSLHSVQTLGLVLVRMLGEHQLGGRYDIGQDGGTRFTLTFTVRNGRKAYEYE
jgi:PAS domain S-box-containing protein